MATAISMTTSMTKKSIILLLSLAAVTTVFVSALTTKAPLPPRKTNTNPNNSNSYNNNCVTRRNRGTTGNYASTGGNNGGRRISTQLGAVARRKSSPLVEEALGEYKFTFRPDNELPGTKGRPIFSTSEKQARETFNELARLYGDQEALDMVKIQPMVLCFQSKNFEPCLEAWTEQFGLEAAQAMVGRNPGLLGVSPQLAAQPAEASMGLSYIVAFTRPSIPKFVALLAILSLVSSTVNQQ